MSVSSSESWTKLMRFPQLCPSTIVFQTSSVHVSHPHRNAGAVVGEGVGVNVGECDGEGLGFNVGDGVGRGEGDRVGAKVSSLASHWHVQMLGNSALTNRQAPSSSKGPSMIPILWRASTSESLRKEIRPPQVYPSAKVFQISSVHESHPHRRGEGLLGDCNGVEGDSSGERVGGTTKLLVSSVLKTVLPPYVL